MEMIGVPEVAKTLGVTDRRVRRLIELQALSAQRVSGRWLLSRAEVERYAMRNRRSGRPFAPAAAWTLLALASGKDPKWAPERTRKRLASVLTERGLTGIVEKLGRRARTEGWYVHPSLRDDLVRRPGVVVTGAHAASLLQSSGAVEVYIAEHATSLLAGEFEADLGIDDPNIIVKVPLGLWPFEAGESVAWPAVVAADLLDRPDDSRALRVAADILRDV